MTISACVSALLLAAAPATSDNPKGNDVPADIAGSVESAGQSGGVTAGNIGTVNQVLPTLVRGPLLEKFKDTFAQGARLRTALLATGRTDVEYGQMSGAASAWATATYNWLHKDFGPYAAERFDFRTNLSLNYSGGPADENVRQQRDNAINAVTGWLQNLDLLMREPSLYPPK